MARPAALLLALLLTGLAAAGPVMAQTAAPAPEGREGVTRPPAGTPTVDPHGKEGGSKSTAPT